MKRSIEQITASSQKGYIDDYDEIDHIFTKLIEKPMEKLGGIKHQVAILQIDSLMECWEITPNANIRSALSVGEYLGLVKALDDDPMVETEKLMELAKRCYYNFLSHLEIQLKQAEESNDTLRLLFSCSINDFLRYAAKKSGRSKGGITNFYRIFGRDVKSTMKTPIKENTTIREYMKKLLDFQRKQWIPNQPISEFEKEIRESYDEFAYLFLESAKLAFPDLFDTKAVLLKYKGISDEVNNDNDIERNDEQWQIS